MFPGNACKWRGATDLSLEFQLPHSMMCFARLLRPRASPQQDYCPCRGQADSQLTPFAFELMNREDCDGGRYPIDCPPQNGFGVVGQEPSSAITAMMPPVG